MTRLLLIGHGEVGRALERRLALGDTPFEIAAIAKRDWRDVLAAGDFDAVVDAGPTDLRAGERELEVAFAAHKRGIPVVSAAKGALALRARDLRGIDYRASAAVCGGTPALESLSGAFRGDKLERFEGVLNGSTNHILSLLEEGDSWDQAIADARTKGILEADPSLDLLGLDAAAKAVILANAAWGSALTLHDADARGIVGIDPSEPRRARVQGMAVRLVARASPELGVAVAPATVPRESPLAVYGKENALRLKFRDAGWITLRGPGAGGTETAAALLSDLFSLAGAPSILAVESRSRGTSSRRP